MISGFCVLHAYSVKQWLKRRITQSLLTVTMLASLLCLF